MNVDCYIIWRVIVEARRKIKKNLKTRFPCTETVAFAMRVHVTMFILMNTGIFICMGRHGGVQGRTRTYRDRQGHQGQARKSMDRHRQTKKSRDKQGLAGTERECLCLSLFVPVFPCIVPALSLLCPWLSLLVPACPCSVPYIDWHTW